MFRETKKNIKGSVWQEQEQARQNPVQWQRDE